MAEIREASAAFSRMAVPDQMMIAATINMMLAMYAGLRIQQLEAPNKSQESKNDETEPA